MATINYAEAYSKALAQQYPKVLRFGKLFTSPNNETYKVVDGKTIKIPVLTVKGRKEGSRDAIEGASRNHDNAWEVKTLSNHRKWSTLIHPMDVQQTGAVMAIMNATRVMNEQEKFPEKDSYLVSKIFADWTALGKTADTTALTTENVLTVIDNFMEAADEANVPQTGRLLYVTPHVNTLIKNAKDLQRYLTATENSVARSIHRVDDLEIIVVPSGQMKTVYDFTIGCVPAEGAKQINMFMVHPTAVLTPESYSFVGLDEPSAKTEGKQLYFEEAFEDAFILNERKDAIAFNTTA